MYLPTTDPRPREGTLSFKVVTKALDGTEQILRCLRGGKYRAGRDGVVILGERPECLTGRDGTEKWDIFSRWERR